MTRNEIDQLITHAHMSFFLCNKSLSEIVILNSPNNTDDEYHIISSLNFYLTTLHYTFNAEFTKLLQRQGQRDQPGNHSASMRILITLIKTTENGKFDADFLKAEQILDKIINSDFYKNQKSLRDKKFSHADLDEINDPLKLFRLTTDEIIIALEQVKMLMEVLRICTLYYRKSDIGYQVPHIDNRTENFIKRCAEYKSFCDGKQLEFQAKRAEKRLLKYKNS